MSKTEHARRQLCNLIKLQLYPIVSSKIMITDNLKTLLDTRELAEMLDVSRSTVRAMLRHGEIPFIRIAGRHRVLKQDLEEYLQHNRHGRLTNEG
jgi:excisionase family DNA binding protein